MRYVFHFLFAANLALLAGMPFLLPPKIAIHFRADGTPGGWGTVWEGMAVLGGTLLLIYLVLWGSILLVRFCPVGLINIPMNADYWKSDENIPEMRRITGRYLYELFAGTLLLMFAINFSMIHANLRNPPKISPEILIGTFVFFGIYFFWWLIRCFLAFRLPKNRFESLGR